jgi:hypothetical protein
MPLPRKNSTYLKRVCREEIVVDVELDNIAFYDKERKGIFLHAQLLQGSPFRPGDRFAVRPRPSDLFSLTIIRDDNGEIFYDKHGIFIARTRRIDILMGGIFDKYVVLIAPEEPGTLKLRPLDVMLDSSQKWY